jgi:hypothetical protein
MKMTKILMRSSRQKGKAAKAIGSRPNCTTRLIARAKRKPPAFFLLGRVLKVYQLEKK